MSLIPVIGLEIHARIKTKTKMFCRCENAAVPDHANQHICPICTGFPGMLPKTNQRAVELATKASVALNLGVNESCKFDRKNYFYPDLPMGYQISQYDIPLAEEGSLTIEREDGSTKDIRIERLHLENDAGKLTHYSHGSFVDYNRSGAPLMEIVSGPDMNSAEEAIAYAKEMQHIMRAVGSSDCDMEKGQMRFDLNISIHEEGTPFGTKVEVKNLNSFKSLEKAIAYEIKRQKKALETGEEIKQETRGWHDTKEVTLSQRSKEEAADYRYFPEPDIPPLHVPSEQVEAAKAALPELPLAKKLRYREEYGIERDVARLLGEDVALSQYFEEVAAAVGDYKTTANWVTSVVLAIVKEEKISLADLPFSPSDVATVITYVKEDKVSQLNGKETLQLMYRENKDPDTIIAEQGFEQVSDTGALEAMVDEVIAAFPNQVEEFKSGKPQLLGFFVGQVMKQSKGSANPKVVAEILQNRL